jgi:hypothetical protein
MLDASCLSLLRKVWVMVEATSIGPGDAAEMPPDSVPLCMQQGRVARLLMEYAHTFFTCVRHMCVSRYDFGVHALMSVIRNGTTNVHMFSLFLCKENRACVYVNECTIL